MPMEAPAVWKEASANSDQCQVFDSTKIASTASQPAITTLFLRPSLAVAVLGGGKKTLFSAQYPHSDSVFAQARTYTVTSSTASTSSLSSEARDTRSHYAQSTSQYDLVPQAHCGPQQPDQCCKKLDGPDGFTPLSHGVPPLSQVWFCVPLCLMVGFCVPLYLRMIRCQLMEGQLEEAELQRLILTSHSANNPEPSPVPIRARPSGIGSSVRGALPFPGDTRGRGMSVPPSPLLPLQQYPCASLIAHYCAPSLFPQSSPPRRASALLVEPPTHRPNRVRRPCPGHSPSVVPPPSTRRSAPRPSPPTAPARKGTSPLDLNEQAYPSARPLAGSPYRSLERRAPRPPHSLVHLLPSSIDPSRSHVPAKAECASPPGEPLNSSPPPPYACLPNAVSASPSLPSPSPCLPYLLASPASAVPSSPPPAAWTPPSPSALRCPKGLPLGVDYLEKLNPDFLLDVVQEYLALCPTQPPVQGQAPSARLLHCSSVLDTVVQIVPGLLQGLFLLARVRFLSGETDPLEPDCTDPLEPDCTDPLEPDCTDPLEPGLY
ncbi:unnamed protein product [Arctogadus glacialis]